VDALRDAGQPFVERQQLLIQGHEVVGATLGERESASQRHAGGGVLGLGESALELRRLAVRAESAGIRVNVTLRVSDGRGGLGTDQVTILVGSGGPSATITSPAAGTLWKVGDVISFSGSGTDPIDGQLPPSALTWTLILHHCPTDIGSCHTHDLQSWTGISTGSFTAPDHEYPAYLELQLTATDSRGLSDTVSRRLDPRTVQLTLASSPGKLQLTLDGTTAASQIVKTVIQNSTHTIGASSQTIGNRSYAFISWSDGGQAIHTIVVTATSKYTATFKKT